MDRQARDPGELVVQMKFKGSLLENSLLLWVDGFIPCRPLTDWVRSAQMMVGNLLTKVLPFKRSFKISFKRTHEHGQQCGDC